MSQENVELARDLFEQWSAGAYEPLIETADPSVEIFSRFASLGGEPYRGREGVRRWIAEIQASLQDMALLLSRAREEIRVMRRIMQLPTGKVLGGIEPDRKTNVTRLAE